MMNIKSLIKNFFRLFLLVFLLMNIMAAFHAYRFTHFKEGQEKIEDPSRLSFGQKLGMAFLGASNPRPVNQNTPTVSYRTIRLQSNKQIECWLIKADSGKGTVALFHGYGGEKSSMLDKAALFREMGYNTLLVDFMGAGGSEGHQSTIGFKEAQQVTSCVQYLQQTGESNIILFGTSMGAAAVLKALYDNPLPVQAVILECPFNSLLQTVKNRFTMFHAPAFPMAHLLVFWGGVLNGFNAFDHKPEEYAQSIKCPALLLYGAKDPKVKPEETKEVFTNLAGPKSLVIFPEAGHENYLVKYKTEWQRAVDSFLNRQTNITTSFSVRAPVHFSSSENRRPGYVSLLP